MVEGVLTNKQYILDAIKQKNGIIAHAASMLKIQRQTIYDWMDRDPEVMQAVTDARETNRRNRIDSDENLVEEAYRAMDYLLRSNDTTATIFALKCKAKWSDKAGDLSQMGYAKTEVVDYSKAVDG